MAFFCILPKIFNFALQKIYVKSLDFSPDLGITANIQVAVISKLNLNKNIGFIYGYGGSVIIQYSDVNLCAGEMPSFKQGGASTAVFDVELKGVTPLRRELLEALMKQRMDRRIPVMLKLKVPVSVVVGKMRLREFKLLIDFSLVVDAFSSGMVGTIVSTETVYRVEFF